MMIPTKELEALMKFASSDDARVHIHGLIVYPAPSRTLATTDAYCAMVRGSRDDLRLQGRLISYGTVMEAIRVAKKLKAAMIRVDRDRGVLVAADVEYGKGFVSLGDFEPNRSGASVEYIHPPPMAMIYKPSAERPAQRIGISAELLSRLAVVSKALKHKTSAWTFTFAGELDPIHAECLDWYALIMPCRI